MPIPGNPKDRIAPKKFPRGARPSSAAAKAAAKKFRVMGAPPDNLAVVPPQLRMWGNDQYGDCVSASEAYAKAHYSVQCGLPELCATDQEVIAWADEHGFLNGAELGEVLDAMTKTGMNIGGTVYTDGPKELVDFRSSAAIKMALVEGPVKIAIDADALPSGAGNSSGWFSTDTTRMTNYDHCVELGAYGSAAFLFGALKVPLPAGLPADTFGYLLFTWSTIGFVTQGWINGCCCEAWLRRPTTNGYTPVPPPPPPPPPPIPSPSWLDMLCLYGPLVVAEPWASVIRFICSIIDREKLDKLMREHHARTCQHGEDFRQ